MVGIFHPTDKLYIRESLCGAAFYRGGKRLGHKEEPGTDRFEHRSRNATGIPEKPRLHRGIARPERHVVLSGRNNRGKARQCKIKRLGRRNLRITRTFKMINKGKYFCKRNRAHHAPNESICTWLANLMTTWSPSFPLTSSPSSCKNSWESRSICTDCTLIDFRTNFLNK